VAEPIDTHAGAALQRLRELCYLRPEQAAELGRSLAAGDGAAAAWGWLHVALAEVRTGRDGQPDTPLAQARMAFATLGDLNGLSWCDEVQGIALRRAGDYDGSARLQAEIDSRSGIDREPLYRFIAHNSRAITQKVLGHCDDALRQFYMAYEAAAESGLDGPRLTALGNLGGYHLDLFNLDDARRLCEEALALARTSGLRHVVTVSAANLVTIRHALGDGASAYAMARYMLDHPAETLPDLANRFPLPLALGHLAQGEVEEALRFLAVGAVAGVADGDSLCDWAWIKARCLLAQGNPVGARELVERTMQLRAQRQLAEQPYPSMQMLQALADACEQLGDHREALRWLREAHARYAHLVGRGARARYIALEVSHQLTTTQRERERDRAVLGHRAAEDDRRRLVELNAELQAKVAETEHLHQQLREQALRDPLTGLHNRRYLYEASPGLLELAHRQKRIVCVALLDLDHFKLLNDTYGHQAGDRVLTRFADLLRETLRRSDIICRYGGEEFVALMPDLDAADAEAVLERLLRALQSLPPLPGRRRVPNGSFSAGIATFPRHGHTLELLLSRADKALYTAKHMGRARIEQVPLTGFGTMA
jgi:diguanylate cyclase (GGDEF)-like protein